jgi:hypothetical protein
MAARYYGDRFGRPVLADGTPCWRAGKFGYLKDQSCDLVRVFVAHNNVADR